MSYRKVKKLIGMLLVVAMLLPVIPVLPVYADTPIDWKLLGTGEVAPPATSFTSLFVYEGTTYVAVTMNSSHETAVFRFDKIGGWQQVGSPLEYALKGSLCADNGDLYLAYLAPDQDNPDNRNIRILKYDLGDPEGDWVTMKTFLGVDDNNVSLYVHNGTPYVAFSGSSRPIVMKYDKEREDFRLIGNDFLWEPHSSLEIKGGGAGNLYLSYVYQGDVEVRKLSADNRWEQVGGIVSGGHQAAEPSLCVYDDTPYVAFTDISQGKKCVVKKFVGSSWLSAGAEDAVSDDKAAGKSLYADDDGILYVAYVAGDGHNARVYRLENNSWVPVGGQGYASGGWVSHLSLAVYEGTAYLAYADDNRYDAAAVMWYKLPVLPPSSVWETVGSGTLSSPYSSFTSLFINEGIPYIAFSDEVGGNDRLVAERLVGNQWEAVGLSRYAAGSVQDGTMYVDEDTDTPYLAYITYEGDVVVLKLADFGEIIDWTTVGRTNSSGASGLSLYVHDGVSYVAYADTSNGYSAVVKSFQGGSKVPVPAVPVGDVGETSVSFLSMKGDAAGNLYLVFLSSPSGQVKVMKKLHSDDQWSMVGDFVSPGGADIPSLYLYDDGSDEVIPYVSYADDQSDDHPIVKKLDHGQWVTVGNGYVSEDPASETSLYVDEHGTPYVAYVIGEGSYSRVFRLDDNRWVPVGGRGYASAGDTFGISLSVLNGVAYLSYVDYDNDSRAVVRRYVPPTPPTISAQSGNQTVMAGQTATFTVTVSGSEPFSYQWFKDGEMIVGANSSILRIINAQKLDEGVYSCNVGNNFGGTVTADARLTVNEPGTLVFTATSGDRHVSLTWNAVPGASCYRIYQDGTPVGTALNNTYDVTGLTNGTAYRFEVKAFDGNDVLIASSGAVSAAPSASSGTSGDRSSSSSGSKPSNSGADILVNGKTENAGTVSTATQGGKTVTTVAVDPEKLKQKLDAEGNHSVVTIPVNTTSDVVIGELNGEMVKNMESKQAVIEVKTGAAAYTLPAQQINIKAISEQLGQNVALGDIKVQIEIAKSAADTVQVVENSAQKGSFTLVVPPVDFTVRCTYGNKTVEVSQFNNYVERTVAIPDGVDPNKITTGVVVDPDGTVRHMPTMITVIDGRYYAVINSLTNSTYSVVWHPLEFKDVVKHWAKEAVNDMGSRMVIDGIGNGLFEPNRDITRAEFAAIVVRGLGLKPGTGKNPFSDVKSSAWYSNSIETASAYGLITGYGNDTFRPMEKITREQAMTIVGRAMEITGLKQDLASAETNAILASFGDSDKTSSWAKESTAACVKEGIVAGKNGNLLVPKANITRAEVAAIVSRLLKESDLIN